MKRSRRLNKMVFSTYSKKLSKKLRPRIKRDFIRDLKYTKRPVEKFDKSKYLNSEISDILIEENPELLPQKCCNVKSFIVFEGRAYDRENFSKQLFWMNPPAREMQFDEEPESSKFHLEGQSFESCLFCVSKRYLNLDEQESKRHFGVSSIAYFGEWESDLEKD